ncbi:MAG: hypothetical protein FJY42_10210 [Betaproteobacteria bacterium]|nr:hypothetical protein [Betaproteobacteria bacterium]
MDLGTSSMSINAALYGKVSYDPVAHFTPIHLTYAMPHRPIVQADSPYRSVSDLIKALACAPNSLRPQPASMWCMCPTGEPRKSLPPSWAGPPCWAFLPDPLPCPWSKAASSALWVSLARGPTPLYRRAGGGRYRPGF